MMKKDEKRIRKTLDLLFESASTFEDLLTIKFAIDDYLDEGYKIQDYIPKYKAFVEGFYAKRN